MMKWFCRLSRTFAIEAAIIAVAPVVRLAAWTGRKATMTLA